MDETNSLSKLLIEQKEWELRKKQSLARSENLSQKKENLSREINDLVQLPDQMLENIKKFDEQLIQAIKAQRNSEDDVVRKETEIREIEKEQKDESLNLEIYKTENIKMESELNIIKSKIDFTRNAGCIFAISCRIIGKLIEKPVMREMHRIAIIAERMGL